MSNASVICLNVASPLNPFLNFASTACSSHGYPCYVSIKQNYQSCSSGSSCALLFLCMLSLKFPLYTWPRKPHTSSHMLHSPADSCTFCLSCTLDKICLHKVPYPVLLFETLICGEEMNMNLNLEQRKREVRKYTKNQKTL